MRSCYKKMLDQLLDGDETSCIEDASIGSSAVTVFLKALNNFCGEVINVTSDQTTFEVRNLYEVVVNKEVDKAKEDLKPVIIIDAGQQGGKESVMLALYVIEQLVACNDNSEMIEKVKWVVLPSTNPDGMEFARYLMPYWKKNLKPLDDGPRLGVDISRNFDKEWNSCPEVENKFSQIYPGAAAVSENETIFIQNALKKYQKNAKIYLSIRRDGHSIAYPYGYSKTAPSNEAKLKRVASEIATRVNQKTNGIYLFVNTSIYELEGKQYCGHSVDYANDLGIPLCFEMRVFLENNNKIISKFHKMPRGFEASLRNGYFSGIRELYNVIVNQKKYPKMFD
ncbi:zinc carboxypeptidase A 1-like [Bombyx mandarina]|uniref:Zinc carboxypeptidase A 1-like n=1 Tax=Bombyx mandarina TaxID=7092 RepID=A0A6J2JSP7_BOMMA|nr:zinc carboxypeptidase A 1-like [Bombyx mandarina]